MNRNVRVSEYYDLFDVKSSTAAVETKFTKLPDAIKPNNEYNTFRGFNNFPITDDSSSIQPYLNTNSQYVEITGKHKAPQATSSIIVVDNNDLPADILCYPPNISVPYWSKVIFRNFDYKINETDDTKARLIADTTNYDLDVNRTMYPWSASIKEYLPPKYDVIWSAADVSAHRTDPSGNEHVSGDVVSFPLWNVASTDVYKTGTPTADYPTNFPAV